MTTAAHDADAAGDAPVSPLFRGLLEAGLSH